MWSIFFDLETTSRHTIGQIVNVACICVDSHWNEVSRFYAEFRLSPLELPSAGAVLANRTDILAHQQKASLSERQGLFELQKYFKSVIDEANAPVALIGYNSKNFDVPYLRTSLIRNGLNPYFGKSLVYRDLLQVVRYCSCFSESFPRIAEHDGDPEKLSLRLETVSRELGLLDGLQSHHSLDDVLLTIEVAKEILNRFKLDVRKFHPYQPSEQDEKAGEIVYRALPGYELSESAAFNVKPYMFLDGDYRSSLWIDLERFAEKGDESTVRYFNRQQSAFFISPQVPEASDVTELALNAEKSLRHIRISNYFKTTCCDIEQDIYRLDFDGIDALYNAIWLGDFGALSEHPGRNARILYLRHWLKEQDWNSPSVKAIETIRQYAEYRYSGSLVLSKHDPESVHPTFSEMLSEIKQLQQTRKNEQDNLLLSSLIKWYIDSPVVKFGLQHDDAGVYRLLEECSRNNDARLEENSG